MKPIILCGLPSSGKTTVGQKLSAHLQWPFIDIDQRVEQAYRSLKGYSLSCRDIFKQEGIQFFRALEKQQIHLMESGQHIISLGGGSVLDEGNRRYLIDLGFIFYLQTSVEEIWKRMQQKELPAYLSPKNAQQDLHQLAEIRLPIYESVAHFIVPTEGLNENQVVQSILEIRNEQNG